jgi:hypothetical protein
MPANGAMVADSASYNCPGKLIEFAGHETFFTDAVSEQLRERGLGANNQGDLTSHSCPVFFEKPQA